MDQTETTPTQQTYHGYLCLSSLLSSQQLFSKSHDEMLFVVQHQTSELWMKLLIHELQYARECIKSQKLNVTNKILARVSRIFELLNQSWGVLRTLTPSEYTKFRGILGNSSGFHSFQYRLIEYMLGNRDVGLLEFHKSTELDYETLAAELRQPSLYDCAIDVLYSTVEKDEDSAPPPQLTQPRKPDKEVQDRWKIVYEESDNYWELYELAEKLVDLEDYFRRWRFNHVTTVERIIGCKKGTGGSSGVPFLRKRLDIVLFPELWNLRGDL